MTQEINRKLHEASEDKKKCNKCDAVKILSEFYNHKRHVDGKSSICKGCANEYQKQYNQNHIDERSTMVRKWKGVNKEKTAVSRRRDYEKKKTKAGYLIKNRIYWLVSGMLKRGEIEKPLSCVICNATGRVVAHHPDYNYPKAIIWVCLKCHHKVHNDSKLALLAIEWMKERKCNCMT